MHRGRSRLLLGPLMVLALCSRLPASGAIVRAAGSAQVPTRIPIATLVAVATSATRNVTLSVTLDKVGSGTFILEKSARVVGLDGVALTTSNLTAGDRLQAVGQAGAQGVNTFDVAVIRDTDVTRKAIEGTVKTVDTLNDLMTVTATNGLPAVTVPIGQQTSIVGTDGAKIGLPDVVPTMGVILTGIFNGRTATFLSVREIRESRVSIPLTVSVARPRVQPADIQTLAVQTAPNASVAVTAQFSGGATTTAHVMVDTSGVVAVPITVPINAYTAGDHTATVSVATTTGGLTRTVDVHFTVVLPSLGLLLSSNRVHTGATESVTVLSHPGTQIKLSILYPNHTAWRSLLRVNRHGIAVDRFSVPKHHLRGSNHTVMVRARKIGGAPVSVSKTFWVQTG